MGFAGWHATERCFDFSFFLLPPALSAAFVDARLHIAHINTAALASIDDPRARGLYKRLRAAYNPARLPGSNPIPPLEEWQGMAAICSNTNCR